MSPPPDAEAFKVRTNDALLAPGRPPAIAQRPHSVHSNLDLGGRREALRGRLDPDPPTNLLQRLEQSTVLHFPVGKKVLRPYVCADDNEARLHAGARYYKRSRGEEGLEEELRWIWMPFKRAGPFDLESGDYGEMRKVRELCKSSRVLTEMHRACCVRAYLRIMCSKLPMFLFCASREG